MTAMIPPEVHAVHLRLSYRSGSCHRCYPAWTTWFADARTNTLRPACVGGVPIEPLDPEVTVAVQEVPSGAAAVTPASSGPRPVVRAG